jgi:hypothetical protein
LWSRGKLNDALPEFQKEQEITPDNVQSYQSAAVARDVLKS